MIFKIFCSEYFFNYIRLFKNLEWTRFFLSLEKSISFAVKFFLKDRSYFKCMQSKHMALHPFIKSTCPRT